MAKAGGGEPNSASNEDAATRRGRPRTPAGRAKLTAERLAIEYPGSAAELVELRYSSPWALLVATVLSAQTTDERVNLVTPALFKRFPGPADLAAASPNEVEEIIRPTGFFRVKSKTLVALANAICERFACEVPASMDELITLPGVGRKTANVVLSVAFGTPGLPVDTHVTRLSKLLGLTRSTDPEKIEADLTAELPRREWGALSLRLILHGRRVCIANRPRCPDCVLADFCPSVRLPTRVAGVAVAKRVGPGERVGAGKRASAPKSPPLKAAQPGGARQNDGQRLGDTKRSSRRVAAPKVRSISKRSEP